MVELTSPSTPRAGEGDASPMRNRIARSMTSASSMATPPSSKGEVEIASAFGCAVCSTSIRPITSGRLNAAALEPFRLIPEDTDAEAAQQSPKHIASQHEIGDTVRKHPRGPNIRVPLAEGPTVSSECRPSLA